MLRIKESTAIGVLSKLAHSLGAHFSKEFSCASLQIDNGKGKGSITAYELFPGLAALIYNIEFTEDLVIEIDENLMDPLYFVFCLDGHLEHKFSGESNFRLINFQQNVILSSSKIKHNIFKFPKNTRIECSFIYLLRDISTESDTKVKYLRSGVNDVLDQIGDFDSYKFFGQIRPQTSIYVDRIIHNDKSGVVARLLVEASILSILALQLEYHNKEKESPTMRAPLKQEELKRILELSDHILESLHESLTIENLSNISRLNPKKLQAGYRYLFGVSANNYIKNVRLERALELIQTTDLSISEIVYKVGLSSRSYFTRIFNERYGYNPSDYKKMISTLKII